MISIGSLVDEEQDISDELENIQETIGNLVASCGRYSSTADLLAAMVIMRKLRNAICMATLEADLAIQSKIKDN